MYPMYPMHHYREQHRQFASASLSMLTSLKPTQSRWSKQFQIMLTNALCMSTVSCLVNRSRIGGAVWAFIISSGDGLNYWCGEGKRRELLCHSLHLVLPWPGSPHMWWHSPGDTDRSSSGQQPPSTFILHLAPAQEQQQSVPPTPGPGSSLCEITRCTLLPAPAPVFTHLLICK